MPYSEFGLRPLENRPSIITDDVTAQVASRNLTPEARNNNVPMKPDCYESAHPVSTQPTNVLRDSSKLSTALF